jgi:hypothetical protein
MISKEAKAIYDKAYREEHREHLKKIKKEWKNKNKAKIVVWVRKWQKSPRGKETIKKWRLKSPKNLRRLYICSAKRRGLTFNISLEDFEKMIHQECIYCGYSPENKRNGLDRINNLRGYELDNVVPCCFICNQMKGKLSVEDFFSHIGRIVTWG